jgi:hypothetical protein
MIVLMNWHILFNYVHRKEKQNKTGLSKKIDKSDRKNMQGIFSLTNKSEGFWNYKILLKCCDSCHKN